MGFADISIADIAEQYQVSPEAVCTLCQQLGIPYQNQHSNLALEDAKAVMLVFIEQQKQPPSSPQSPPPSGTP